MSEPCCPCTTKVGDTFGLPPEPPVGAELRVSENGQYQYTIVHDNDGWFIKGTGRHNCIQWKSAFRAWLSEPGTVATVVRLP